MKEIIEDLDRVLYHLKSRDIQMFDALSIAVNKLKEFNPKFPQVIVEIGGGIVEKIIANTTIEFTIVDFDTLDSNRTKEVPFDHTMVLFQEAMVHDDPEFENNAHLAAIISNLKNN